MLRQPTSSQVGAREAWGVDSFHPLTQGPPEKSQSQREGLFVMREKERALKSRPPTKWHVIPTCFSLAGSSYVFPPQGRTLQFYCRKYSGWKEPKRFNERHQWLPRLFRNYKGQGPADSGTMENKYIMGALVDLVCISSLKERDSYLHPWLQQPLKSCPQRKGQQCFPEFRIGA
jgi:hypothetical protein